jgi:hypothetical protein
MNGEAKHRHILPKEEKYASACIRRHQAFALPPVYPYTYFCEIKHLELKVLPAIMIPARTHCQ